MGPMAGGTRTYAADLLEDHITPILGPADISVTGMQSSPRHYDAQTYHLAAWISGGVRFDALDWNIAGNNSGSNPNVLSELEWSHVTSYQLSFGGRATVGRHFYTRGHINYAWIQSGEVQDSDYNGNNRTLEYSRSISETDDDYLWDIEAGAGYPFTFLNDRFFLAPMVGVSIHTQDFRITDGQQIISTGNPPVGPLDASLNSRYDAEWFGLWTGCDLRYQMAAFHQSLPAMSWGLALAYHFSVDYTAQANWNLRSDLQHPVSFEHEADGQGISVAAEWLIPFSAHFEMRFNFNYARWWTDHGVDTVYEANGNMLTTRLNEVNWHSHSLMVGVVYAF
jgi:hypothetical protein